MVMAVSAEENSPSQFVKSEYPDATELAQVYRNSDGLSLEQCEKECGLDAKCEGFKHSRGGCKLLKSFTVEEAEASIDDAISTTKKEVAKEMSNIKASELELQLDLSRDDAVEVQLANAIVQVEAVKESVITWEKKAREIKAGERTQLTKIEEQKNVSLKKLNETQAGQDEAEQVAASKASRTATEAAARMIEKTRMATEEELKTGETDAKKDRAEVIRFQEHEERIIDSLRAHIQNENATLFGDPQKLIRPLDDAPEAMELFKVSNGTFDPQTEKNIDELTMAFNKAILQSAKETPYLGVPAELAKEVRPTFLQAVKNMIKEGQNLKIPLVERAENMAEIKDNTLKDLELARVRVQNLHIEDALPRQQRRDRKAKIERNRTFAVDLATLVAEFVQEQVIIAGLSRSNFSGNVSKASIAKLQEVHKVAADLMRIFEASPSYGKGSSDNPLYANYMVFKGTPVGSDAVKVYGWKAQAILREMRPKRSEQGITETRKVQLAMQMAADTAAESNLGKEMKAYFLQRQSLGKVEENLHKAQKATAVLRSEYHSAAKADKAAKKLAAKKAKAKAKAKGKDAGRP